MSEFVSLLKEIQGFVKDAGTSAYKKLDKATYTMLIDGLKGEDPESVKVVIDQLKKERHPLAIPPMFIVAHMHPIAWVRTQAQNALLDLAGANELEGLTSGKTFKEQVKILLEHYGNYRD